MKKILMALAAAAILAGCSKNEQENVDGFTPKQIKFTNLNDKLTRAANDGNDPYRVYAAWSGGTGWFINDQVSASDVPSGGPYYWPASGSVDFYAWAPADVAATGTYPTLSIAYEVPANANKDFGIARISRAENQLSGGKAMGSVHYISPEQAKGDETDCTSDIYSVGVMMYEMLSGHLPFDADDMVEVAIKQISDTPKSLHELAPEVPNALVEITEKAMAKLPQNRYASALEMLNALDTYVQNPSVQFEYQYITEDAPEKVVKRTMNQNRANRRAETPAPHSKKAAPRKKRRTIFLPALFGITVAFVIACLALCWMILNDSSNLMNNKADVTLGDYVGMTRDEAQAAEQVVSGQITVNWEEEYNSNYAAGYVYKQSPVAGRTVREGQNVTLTVSLGTQYVTVPDLTNYVQADAEQQLKNLGVSVLVTHAYRDVTKEEFETMAESFRK